MGMSGPMQGKGGSAGGSNPSMQLPESFDNNLGGMLSGQQPRMGQPNPYSNTTPEMGAPQMMGNIQGGPAGGKGQSMMPQGKGQ
jgi:hypothetical protein